jgi:nucleotide-binding universal stress UspA family protein
MKLERILVGIDFSAPSISAARWVAAHFAPSAELVLAHSVFIPEPPRFLRGRFSPPGPLIENARVGAEVRLSELAKSLRPAKTRIEVAVGHPANLIPQLAAHLQVDLLAIGKQRERRGTWRMLGGTAEQILRTVRTPVLLAGGVRDVRPRHILLALDDPDASSPAVEWARKLVTHFGAQGTALHVVASALSSSVLAMAAVGSGAGAESGAEGSRAELHAEVDRFLQELVPPTEQSRWRTDCVFGEPGREIVAMAERHSFELIVMGGGGSAAHPALGPIAGEVLHGAHCPVLVTPHA